MLSRRNFVGLASLSALATPAYADWRHPWLLRHDYLTIRGTCIGLGSSRSERSLIVSGVVVDAYCEKQERWIDDLRGRQYTVLRKIPIPEGSKYRLGDTLIVRGHYCGAEHHSELPWNIRWFGSEPDSIKGLE